MGCTWISGVSAHRDGNPRIAKLPQIRFHGLALPRPGFSSSSRRKTTSLRLRNGVLQLSSRDGVDAIERVSRGRRAAESDISVPLAHRESGDDDRTVPPGGRNELVVDLADLTLCTSTVAPAASAS